MPVFKSQIGLALQEQQRSLCLSSRTGAVQSRTALRVQGIVEAVGKGVELQVEELSIQGRLVDAATLPWIGPRRRAQKFVVPVRASIAVCHLCPLSKNSSKILRHVPLACG